MSTFRDHFSFAAGSYAAYRPHYPPALFDWLATVVPRRERAWDCGTGSGQAAEGLSEHFDAVIATDPSIPQLTSAAPGPEIHYAAMAAEQAALATNSVDLVTVAQALHWFHLPRFFAEVDRVLRPGGALAVWSYGLVTVDPAIDRRIGYFYRKVLGRYWPIERSLVDSGYAGIELPYPELVPPSIEMEERWTMEQMGGYLSTWSAIGRYRHSVGEDPLPAFLRELATEWDATTARRVSWPLIVRVARKDV